MPHPVWAARRVTRYFVTNNMTGQSTGVDIPNQVMKDAQWEDAVDSSATPARDEVAALFRRELENAVGLRELMGIKEDRVNYEDLSFTRVSGSFVKTYPI